VSRHSKHTLPGTWMAFGDAHTQSLHSITTNQCLLNSLDSPLSLSICLFLGVAALTTLEGLE
jgi:hypothetical protein